MARPAGIRPLQDLIDEFVRAEGGQLVTDVMLPPEGCLNADYVFRQENTIVELKSLEEELFNSGFRKKMAQRAKSWERNGWLQLKESKRMPINELPPECQADFHNVIGRALQDRFLKKANRQLKDTRKMLSLPDAKGLLLVANDGADDLVPSFFGYILDRELKKRKPDGTLQYSGINGAIFFNPRAQLHNLETGQATMVWMMFARDGLSEVLGDFPDRLGAGWNSFLIASGFSIVEQQVVGQMPTLRFSSGLESPLFEVHLKAPRGRVSTLRKGWLK